ncbi:MAG TPA: DUF4129 domain-containing protein [Gaiellaceae bacterium]|nr:DUF4129 domain-containing protein [Gaiellaceae bacterium]
MITCALLLVLLALIAIGSRDGALGRGTQARPTPGYIDWAMSIFLILFVLMIPVAVYAYGIQMREFRAQRDRQSFQSRVLRGFAVIAVVMVAALVFTLLKKHGLHVLLFKGLTGAGGAAGANGKKGLHTTPYNPTFRWPVLWVTLLVLAAVGAIWWRKRGIAQAVPAWSSPAEDISEDVLASIEGAIDDLEAEPDARRAVIAAYARMERVLARHGLRRKQSETAVEYLGRVLLGLTSRADAVTRLTGLFEQAKFSHHEIDGAMKQEAIDALRTIRDDLHGAPA